MISSSVVAGDPNDSFELHLYWENDGSIFKPNGRTDRHYTNGTKIAISHRPSPSHWSSDFLQSFPGKPSGKMRAAVGYLIGQNIYTPDHVGVPKKRGPNDRKFAGWLYGGIYLQRSDEELHDHLELNLGVIGPSSLAEPMQRAIHDTFDLTDPKGWSGQLDDEVAFDLIYQRKWKFSTKDFAGCQAQFIPQVGCMLGTAHRNLNIDATFRFGLNLPADFGPGRLLDPVSSTYLQRVASTFSTYAFVRVGGKLVEHNRFLTGLSPEPFMAELQVGIVLEYKKLQLGYSQTFQTREYSQQSGKDSFGALTASWMF